MAWISFEFPTKYAFTLTCLRVIGKSKANREWTPLHLASYFGHASVVELLIKRGADLNAINDKGDTPLHKAAYTSRLDIVTLLLKANASLHILNTEGKKPVQLANQEEVRKLIQAAQQTEMARNEKKFLHCASSGDIDTLQTLVGHHLFCYTTFIALFLVRWGSENSQSIEWLGVDIIYKMVISCLHYSQWP